MRPTDRRDCFTAGSWSLILVGTALTNGALLVTSLTLSGLTLSLSEAATLSLATEITGVVPRLTKGRQNENLL